MTLSINHISFKTSESKSSVYCNKPRKTLVNYYANQRLRNALLKNYNQFLSREKLAQSEGNNNDDNNREQHNSNRNEIPKTITTKLLIDVRRTVKSNNLTEINLSTNLLKNESNINEPVLKDSITEISVDERTTKTKVNSITDKENSNNNLHNESCITEPLVRLQDILRQATDVSSMEIYAALDLKKFFIDITAEHIAAYTNDVIVAVCTQDIGTLRDMHRNGQMLQCCNRHGESIVHMACRRGAIEVVRFLSEEAGVSFRVRDDFGRTPLHDAFWTVNPQMDLVKMLLSNCPDLLFISDKHGFVPISYVRKEHWSVWCKFLEENSDMLLPKQRLIKRQ